MRIHQYERLWLIGAMVLIVGFIVTITYGAVGLGITMVDDQEATLPPDDIDDDERFADPASNRWVKTSTRPTSSR